MKVIKYTVTEALKGNTTYFWRIQAGNSTGDSDWSESLSFTTEIVTSINDHDGVPENFTLSQNYPNPFNPSTQIKFSIPVASFVTLEVYSALGGKVRTLVNKGMSAGVHSFNFDASDLSSGMYFYRIKANDYVEIKKMLLIK